MSILNKFKYIIHRTILRYTVNEKWKKNIIAERKVT